MAHAKTKKRAMRSKKCGRNTLKIINKNLSVLDKCK